MNPHVYKINTCDQFGTVKGSVTCILFMEFSTKSKQNLRAPARVPHTLQHGRRGMWSKLRWPVSIERSCPCTAAPDPPAVVGPAVVEGAVACTVVEAHPCPCDGRGVGVQTQVHEEVGRLNKGIQILASNVSVLNHKKQFVSTSDVAKKPERSDNQLSLQAVQSELSRLQILKKKCKIAHWNGCSPKTKSMLT